MHAGFPAVPRNRAIKQGNSKIIAILDDDDLWLPNKLECQIDFLKDHPECILLGCNAYFWDGTDNWNKSPLYFKKERLGKISYYKLLSQNYLIHSSLIFSRKAVEQSGLYNERLDPPIGEDYELCLRVGALGEIWSLPDPYVVYRQTPSTFYKKLDRRDSYRAAVNVFESVLNGVDNVVSPLSYPENAHLAAACRNQRDFYLAGPRFMGRLRYEVLSKIKQFFNFEKT
jgi:GT2 family glycosyltransferase